MSTHERGRAVSVPAIGGLAVPDASAAVGALVWLAAVLAGSLGTDLGLDIATMVALHGSLNAFGFALLGLVGWRLSVPRA